MSNLSRQNYLLRPEKALPLRKELESAAIEALGRILKTPIQARINSSSINHTVLEPEGEKFTIQIVVTVHPQPEKKTPPV